MRGQKFAAMMRKHLRIHMPDLLTEVKQELRGRTPDEWETIAKDAKVSPSMIAQLGRGHYKSCPTYRNLTRIAESLRRHPRLPKAVAA